MKSDIRDCVSDFYRLLENTSDLQIRTITKNTYLTVLHRVLSQKYVSDRTASSVITKSTYLLVLYPVL